MKPILIPALLFLFAFSPTVRAATESMTTSLTSIEKGKWRVGGGLDFSYSDVQSLVFNVNPNAEYFFTDDFSFGASGSAAFCGDVCSSWSIGPSATYYFWKGERVVAFIGQSLSYARYGYDGEAFAFHTMTSTTKLGVEYFITKAVSFSPEIQWRHAFDAPVPTAYSYPRNAVSLVGQFSIYF